MAHTNNSQMLGPARASVAPDGSWLIAPDPANAGRAEGWHARVHPDAIAANVPGVVQQALPGYHGVAWYWHTFRTTEALGAGPAPRTRVRLRFGGVDYLAEVWLNARRLGEYEGGETPFEFDVTDAIRWDADNLLAVRVLNPTTTPIDGYALDEIPHRNKLMYLKPGSSQNVGGIVYPVALLVVPDVRIADVFARPDAHTGRVAVTVTAFSSLDQAREGSLTLSISTAGDGRLLDTCSLPVAFQPGESTFEAAVEVRDPRRWDLDDPVLYQLAVGVQEAGNVADARTLRVGFRELRVEDGYFRLNGRRIFLKSTHTGNHMPFGVTVPALPDFVRRDMVYAKASGFNMVRFISGTAYPAQLDFCDELGLMVYEECLAAWKLGDSPHMGARFDRSTGDMIRRDRNHACVTIWGLLNETANSPTYQHAVAYLPTLRKLDPTRLVLLSSGRWDAEPSTGSLSNPGGSTWEHAWGVESPQPPVVASVINGIPQDLGRLPPPGYVDRAGDAHVYPQMPLKRDAAAFVRHLGHDSKPVFLSEYGIGSLQNVIREWRNWELTGAPPLAEGAFLRDQVTAFEADWKRLGFEDVYPFPEDMLRDSQRLHARQRAYAFDLIRANPQLCGYNLTGMLDHALTGEGLWTFFREWKPATFDAVSEGWAPLRWCLLPDATHLYAGELVTVEASLANENALPPGGYPARFRLLGPAGIAWEEAATITIPDPAPLATVVLRATIRVDGPPGTYTFAASLERGGAPSGGRLTLHVSDRAALPRLGGKLGVWGIGAQAEGWLTGHGLTCRSLWAADGQPGDVMVVGLPPEAERSAERMAALTARIRAGATAIFLQPEVFRAGADSTAYLPLNNRGRVSTAVDWLYHKECVARRHPVFDGLQGPGIMDWDYYGPVVPFEIYEGLDAPDEMIAASFAVGHHRYPTGYAWELLIGAYRVGAGIMVLCTPPVLPNLDQHPCADRLLVNLIRHVQFLSR